MGSRKRNDADPRMLVIGGINYYVDWEKMLPGHSVFLKTLAAPAAVRSELRRVERALNIKLAATHRREFGRYGVRVWRMA